MKFPRTRDRAINEKDIIIHNLSEDLATFKSYRNILVGVIEQLRTIENPDFDIRNFMDRVKRRTGLNVNNENEIAVQEKRDNLEKEKMAQLGSALEHLVAENMEEEEYQIETEAPAVLIENATIFESGEEIVSTRVASSSSSRHEPLEAPQEVLLEPVIATTATADLTTEAETELPPTAGTLAAAVAEENSDSILLVTPSVPPAAVWMGTADGQKIAGKIHQHVNERRIPKRLQQNRVGEVKRVGNKLYFY